MISINYRLPTRNVREWKFIDRQTYVYIWYNNSTFVHGYITWIPGYLLPSWSGPFTQTSPFVTYSLLLCCLNIGRIIHTTAGFRNEIMNIVIQSKIRIKSSHLLILMIPALGHITVKLYSHQQSIYTEPLLQKPQMRLPNLCLNIHSKACHGTFIYFSVSKYDLLMQLIVIPQTV